MPEDSQTTTERSNELQNQYVGAAQIADKNPRVVAATDLRHALGMEQPANSLNKEVMARTLSIVQQGSTQMAGLLQAENTAQELRENLADELELSDEPRSLGPVMYKIMAHVEEQYDAEHIGEIAIQNKTDDEADFEQAYLTARYEAAQEADSDEE